MFYRKLTSLLLGVMLVFCLVIPVQAASLQDIGASQTQKTGTRSVLLPFVAGSVLNRSSLTPQRIRFSAGRISETETGSLAASASHLYVLRALKGQTMTADLRFTQGQAILVVWGADGTVLMSDHAGASHFQGKLPSTQDYYILVEGRPEGATNYSLLVAIPPLTSNQTASAPQRIRFAAGRISATETGRLAASGSHLYVLRALKDQTMTLNLSFTKGEAILAVWGADGTVLMADQAEEAYFQGKLPDTQDYYILLEGRPDGATQYSLQVTIPALP
jgi:hypothetical protein